VLIADIRRLGYAIDTRAPKAAHVDVVEPSGNNSRRGGLSPAPTHSPMGPDSRAREDPHRPCYARPLRRTRKAIMANRPSTVPEITPMTGPTIAIITRGCDASGMLADIAASRG